MASVPEELLVRSALPSPSPFWSFLPLTSTCIEDGGRSNCAGRSTLRESALRNILLLAPRHTGIPVTLNRTREDDEYGRLLSEMQRLRGRIALEEGAIQPQELTSDFRHFQPIDDQSWHILTTDANGKVCGCARYHQYEPGTRYQDLAVAHSALARSEVYGNLLAEAIEWEIRQASERGVSFADVGGWTVDQAWRCTTVPITLALATYALAARLGHCVAITTATRKSSSARILRRLGGDTLRIGSMPFPSYFDGQYGCEVELLRFDSLTPSSKYRSKIAEIEAHLPLVRIVAAGQSSELYSALGAAQAA